MQIAKILCPTDFSPGSEQALGVATRLAIERGAELVIAYSWYLPPLAFSGEYGFPTDVVDQMTNDARRGLDRAVGVAKQAGVERVTSKLLTGVPWAELVALLEKDRFDLCVIGTHGRTGLGRVLLGSVAERVIRHAPCSVLAVHPGAEAKPFSHVLVPTDLSESAHVAEQLATDLVEATGTITLLHVIELPVAYSGTVPVEGMERDLDRRACEALEKTTARLASRTSATIKTSWRIGYPGAETLRALDHDPTIDLVVMGSHGRTGIKRALLGSVAEKVARHAQPPVLVARKRA